MSTCNLSSKLRNTNCTKSNQCITPTLFLEKFTLEKYLRDETKCQQVQTI